jgi:hypothetical protein
MSVPPAHACGDRREQQLGRVECIRVSSEVHDALKSGATEDEVIETIGVAVMMGGGPAVVYGCDALEALNRGATGTTASLPVLITNVRASIHGGKSINAVLPINVRGKAILRTRRRMKIRFKIQVQDAAGNARTASRTVTLKLTPRAS